MKIKQFLKLVEIQTKVASIFPFCIGTAFSFYYYNNLKIINILLMLISLLCIDMATTAINNYIDYKKAIKKEGYNYEEHNSIKFYNLKEEKVIITIIILLLLAIFLGIVLVYFTDLLVLIIGILSFGVGILYSFGPIPISRTPFGEIFSGFIMGFFITFLAVYINIYDLGLIIFMLDGWELIINICLKDIILIFMVSFPIIMFISNIMLANNLCDMEDDIENNRFTLPIYIGKERALQLFKIIYYLAYLAIIIMVITRVLPLTSVLILITIVHINNNIKKFTKNQNKKSTFILSVKNFVIFNFSYLLSLLLAVVIQCIIK